MTLIEKIQNEISENEIMYATIAKPSHQMANAHAGTIAGLMIALNLAKEHSDWVSADIRPPKDDSFWLVCTEHGRIAECRFMCDEWITTYVNGEKVVAYQDLPSLPSFFEYP